MRTIGLLGLLLLCGIARMSQCGEWSEPAVHPPVDNVVVDRRAVEDEPSPSADADERASPQRHATPEREIRSKKPSLIQVPTDDPPYVVGRVLLPEGAPASGAFVVVEDPAGPASVTLADETGAFRFTGFTAELVLRAERVSITATWQESFTDLTTGADPDLWRLDRRCWWTEAEVDPREEAVLTLQPTGGVRGRVVDDLGAPWEVELTLECAPQDPRPGPVYDPKMPGPTGIRRVIFQGPDFQLGGLLHGGGWAVWAQLGSWSSSIESVDCGGGTEEVTLVLPRATVVRGSVLHHDGRPAPGRLVHAVPKTYWVNFYINPPPDPDGHSCSCPAHAETDDAGRFELEILGAGPVRLTCIDAEAFVDPFPGGVVAGVTLQLSDERPAILVVDVLNRPDGFRAWQLGLGHPHRRLLDGRFEFRLQPGEHAVEYRSRWWRGPSSLLAHISLEPGERREIRVRIDPQRGVQVHGRATLCGAPLTGTLAVHDRVGGSTTIPLDARGEFEVRLNPGFYRAAYSWLSPWPKATRPTAVPDGEELPLVVPDQAEHVVQLHFGTDTYDLRGRVLGGDEHTWVAARPLHARLGGGANIDGAGVFLLHGLRPGRYSLYADGTRGYATEIVDVHEEGQEVLLVLREPCAMRIAIIRADGRPARFPQVVICPEATVSYRTGLHRERPGGIVHERDLPAGRWAVIAAEGNNSGTGIFTLVPGRTTEGRVELRPVARLQVSVRGPDGAPLDCRVWVIDPAGRDLVAKEKLGIDLPLTRLPAGSYAIGAAHPAFGSLTRTIELRPGADEKVELTLDG